MRRSRAHKAGDHSLCVRCAVIKARPENAPPVADPLAEMRLLAGQLAAACRVEPGNASLARELRMTLQALMDPGGTVDGELAEFLAGFSGT
jgi:hypothetical protein